MSKSEVIQAGSGNHSSSA